MATRLNKAALKPRKRPVIEAPFLTLALAVTFGLGLAAPIAGFFLVVVHAAMPELPAIADLATVLIIITIPLLLVSSHLMDLCDSKKEAGKAAAPDANDNDN